MVDGVCLAPVRVGGERKNPQHEAKRVVGNPGSEEGAVATVVLDDEEPDQETGGRQREKQRDPVGILEAGQHEEPQEGEWNSAVEHLEYAPSHARLCVGPEYLGPGFALTGSGSCQNPTPILPLLKIVPISSHCTSPISQRVAGHTAIRS